MARAIIYTRFSPRRTKGDKPPESPKTQEATCRAFCAEHGHEVESVYGDRYASGDDEDRPELWKAVDLIRRGWVLCVYRFDRLARGASLAHLIQKEVMKRGGSLISATGEGEIKATLSPEEQFKFEIMSSASRYEQRVTALRTKIAMRRHQSQGIRQSRVDRLPYGWALDENSPLDPASGLPTGMVRDDGEQRLIERVLALSAGGEGPRGIARQLNDEGEKCRGGKWWHGTIRSILRREGKVPFGVQ